MMEDQAQEDAEERMKRRQLEMEAVLGRVLSELTQQVAKVGAEHSEMVQRFQRLETGMTELSGMVERTQASQKMCEEKLHKLEDGLQRLERQGTADQQRIGQQMEKIEANNQTIRSELQAFQHQTHGHLQQMHSWQNQTNEVLRQEIADALNAVLGETAKGQTAVAQRLRAELHGVRQEVQFGFASISSQAPSPPGTSVPFNSTTAPTPAAVSNISSITSAVPLSSSINITPGNTFSTHGVSPSPTVRPELRLRRSRSAQPTLMPGHTAPVIINSAAVPTTADVSHPVPTIHIRQVEAHVAPVQAAASPTAPFFSSMAGAGAYLPMGVAQALAGKEPGKFTGNTGDWALWRRRWLLYVEEIEQLLPALTGRQKLSLLRHFLDSASAESLDDEMQRSPDLDYAKFWSRLDLSFGAEDREGLRRQLRNLKLNTRGKLQEREWREFATRALVLSRQLGDVTDVEVGRLLTDALPPQPWRRKLAEEAERRSAAGVLVIEGMPEDVTEAEMDMMIQQETGQRPQRVKKDGKRMKVTTDSESHRETIKAVYDRQSLQCGAVITVAPESVELTGDMVHTLMLKWLRIDAKVSAGIPKDSQTESMYRPQSNFQRARFHREVKADNDDIEDDGQEEAEVAAVRDAKGGGKG